MPEEILTLVRIPIAEIESSVRAKHILPKTLIDVRIDGNTLVLYFGGEPTPNTEKTSFSPGNVIRRRRRAHRKRNRIKTRGWKKVASFVNSKGQKCAIYKPFVDALSDPNLTAKEQTSLVEKILKSNRNRPSDISIQYFLGNTLEYLQNQAPQQSSGQERMAE